MNKKLLAILLAAVMLLALAACGDEPPTPPYLPVVRNWKSVISSSGM